MRRDVSNWTKANQHCQAAKVTKHNTTASIVMAPSCGKFHDIHLDIVGPLNIVGLLNELKGKCYILTAVDCFSHWTMAEPMPNQLASTVAHTFIKVGYSITAFLIPSQQTEARTLCHHFSSPSCKGSVPNTSTRLCIIHSTMGWWNVGTGASRTLCEQLQTTSHGLTACPS